MHYFSKFLNMNFKDAVSATRRSLEAHNLKILAEIDLRDALRKHLAADFRTYVILGACNLPLAQRAIHADENIGSILLCNVVVQEHEGRGVEISVVDPDSTIGTINHVDLKSTARELRALVQHAIDDVEAVPKSQRLLRDGEAGNHALAL
jgi:uncharacterized protein (DUF302 family)